MEVTKVFVVAGRIGIRGSVRRENVGYCDTFYQVIQKLRIQGKIVGVPGLLQMVLSHGNQSLTGNYDNHASLDQVVCNCLYGSIQYSLFPWTDTVLF